MEGMPLHQKVRTQDLQVHSGKDLLPVTPDGKIFAVVCLVAVRLLMGLLVLLTCLKKDLPTNLILYFSGNSIESPLGSH
jgi:hypothetical protein